MNLNFFACNEFEFKTDLLHEFEFVKNFCNEFEFERSVSKIDEFIQPNWITIFQASH